MSKEKPNIRGENVENFLGKKFVKVFPIIEFLNYG